MCCCCRLWSCFVFVVVVSLRHLFRRSKWFCLSQNLSSVYTYTISTFLCSSKISFARKWFVGTWNERIYVRTEVCLLGWSENFTIKSVRKVCCEMKRRKHREHRGEHWRQSQSCYFRVVCYCHSMERIVLWNLWCAQQKKKTLAEANDMMLLLLFSFYLSIGIALL